MGALFSYSLTVSLTLMLAWGGYRLGRGGSPRLRRIILLAIYALALIAVPAALSVGFGGAYGSFGVGEVAPRVDVRQVTVAGAPVSSALLITLAAIYTCGVIVCLGFTARELIKVIRLARGAERRNFGSCRVFVIERDGVAPFSFANIIVVGRRDADNNAVLTHEAAHIRRRHTLDMLLAQAVAALCWYCPAAWRLRSELRMVHEFEADSAVIGSGFDAGGYSRMLLERASGLKLPSMVSAFNYKCLKQRIFMLQKPVEGKRGAMRIMLTAIAVVLAGVCAKIPAVNDALSNISRISLAQQGDDVENRSRAFAVYGMDSQDEAVFCADMKVLRRLAPQVVKYMVDGKMISAREFDRIDAASLLKVIVSERTIIAVTRNYIDYDYTDPLGEAADLESQND